jgi:excisionase family DNA binding protein
MSSNSENEAHQFMTVEEAARELRVQRSCVLKLLNKKRLPGVRLGRKWLIPVEWFNDYIRKLLNGGNTV